MDAIKRATQQQANILPGMPRRINEPQQDAVACREKNDNGCLGRINGEMPPPSEPFPEQKKEECHKNQALHAGFQCTDGRKHTAGAGNPVSFKTFILHAERRPRGAARPPAP